VLLHRLAADADVHANWPTDVGARAAIERIHSAVVGRAAQTVVARVAVQDVYAGTAGEGVGAAAAAQGVGAVAAGEGNGLALRLTVSHLAAETRDAACH